MKVFKEINKPEVRRKKNYFILCVFLLSAIVSLSVYGEEEWVTFRSDIHGYSIQHPSNWHSSKATEADNEDRLAVPAGELCHGSYLLAGLIDIAVKDSDGLSLDTWIDNNCFRVKYGREHNELIDKRELSFKVGGETAMRVKYANDEETVPDRLADTFVYVKKGEYIYAFYFLFTGSKPEFELILQRILKSFKFTEVNN